MDNAEAIRQLARSQGVIRARDVEALGIHRKHLADLVRSGELEQPGRGLYRLTSAPLTEKATLTEIASRIPHGVLCLLSALSFHELTTQSPSETWMAIEYKAWQPTGLPSRVRIVRMTNRWLSDGVDTHDVGGVPIHVTSPARTVVDCFRFRSIVGLDVAIEALRDALHKRQATVGELDALARDRRVVTVMRPYVQALVS